ncbi:MAG: YdeI family protein [Bauldia sp.]
MKDLPVYFVSRSAWRDWLEANHASSDGITVGMIKKAADFPGVYLDEVVDEALCFGWIDSLARSVDDKRWSIRMSPRKPNSPWSARNIARVERLIAEGRMTPAGLVVFERRNTPKRTSESA